MNICLQPILFCEAITLLYLLLYLLSCTLPLASQSDSHFSFLGYLIWDFNTYSSKQWCPHKNLLDQLHAKAITWFYNDVETVWSIKIHPMVSFNAFIPSRDSKNHHKHEEVHMNFVPNQNYLHQKELIPSWALTLILEWPRSHVIYPNPNDSIIQYI